jgi:hypothetical protein
LIPAYSANHEHRQETQARCKAAQRRRPAVASDTRLDRYLFVPASSVAPCSLVCSPSLFSEKSFSQQEAHCVHPLVIEQSPLSVSSLARLWRVRAQGRGYAKRDIVVGKDHKPRLATVRCTKRRAHRTPSPVEIPPERLFPSRRIMTVNQRCCRAPEARTPLGSLCRSSCHIRVNVRIAPWVFLSGVGHLGPDPHRLRTYTPWLTDLHSTERNLGGERKRRATGHPRSCCGRRGCRSGRRAGSQRSGCCLGHQILTRWLGGRKSLSPCLTEKAA